jgi:phage tail-like protein
METLVGTNRFYVFVNSKPQAVFTDASGLQMETELLDHIEGGNNLFVHKLPGRTKVSNLTFKSGLTNSQGLFKWYCEIVQGKITRQNISVVVFDAAGQQVCKWEFHRAFPVKWIGPQFSAGANTMAIETLEFAHEGLFTDTGNASASVSASGSIG